MAAEIFAPEFSRPGYAKGVLHLDCIGPYTPHLPHLPFGLLNTIGASAMVHTAAVLTVVVVARLPMRPLVENPSARPAGVEQHVDVRHVVFIDTDRHLTGGGGGGGGNRQLGPLRHAEGVGADAITLRIQKRPRAAQMADVATSPMVAPAAEPLASVVLDAKPLASGSFDQIGLPTGGVSSGTSTGPGSGGGVGTGAGTGIGSGRGPGMGPGFGGGIGGGAYRPGGAVTPPRVIAEVKPTYTADALLNKIQGTVVLELVVTREGHPTQIGVIRSLDPDGLDEQAIAAAAQWRFEPGRLAGTPVDVLVTIMLDFWIR